MKRVDPYKSEFRQHSSDRLDEEPSTFGRWTTAEHDLFLEGLRLHNRNWPLIAKLIGSRNTVQTRTHAQKYFIKQDKRNGIIRPHSNSYLHPDQDFENIDESTKDVAAILIGSLMKATPTPKVSPQPVQTPANKRQRVSNLISDDQHSDFECQNFEKQSKSTVLSDYFAPQSTPLTTLAGGASALLDAIYGVYNHSDEPPRNAKPTVHRIPEEGEGYGSPNENDPTTSKQASSSSNKPQYSNNYYTYNIQMPANFTGSATYGHPPRNKPLAQSLDADLPLLRHLSKKDKFDLVQRAQQLEQQRPVVKGLQMLLASEFGVCASTVYHVLRCRERVEEEYYEQLVRQSRASPVVDAEGNTTASASSPQLSTEEADQHSSPSLDGLGSGDAQSLFQEEAEGDQLSTISGRLRMYEAYQPVDAVEQQDEGVVIKEEEKSEEPSPAEAAAEVKTEDGTEAVAQQVAIMSRFEEIVAEQLDVHGVTTSADAHKYTEWYATYYGIKTLEGQAWHCSDEWFERFNAVYMDGRFVE